LSCMRCRRPIAVLLAGGAEFIILQYAIARIGCISVPVNFRLKAPELHHILAQSRSARVAGEPEIPGPGTVQVPEPGLPQRAAGRTRRLAS
jgi:acyl-CoA synthetase (AMP-forming)/AMP-acid ligase II